MNKSNLISHVAAHASLDKAAADRAVSAVFAAIAETLARDETVSVPGFGRFTTRTRAARRGRNPATGEEIAIAASRAPSFKPATALRDALNP